MIKKQIAVPVTGYSIQADWYESTGQDILLAFVGLNSSKENNGEFIARVVSDTGVSALVVDLSGHGNSPFDLDETTPAQHVLEAAKAYDWIKARYPESAVHVMGTSYGGFIAAYLSRFREVQKLILRTPAMYEPNDFYTEHRYIDKILVREYRRNSVALKKHPLFLQKSLAATSTLLIVHGEDKSVPHETTDAYREVFANKPYVAESFAHFFRDPSNPPTGITEYYETIANWLNT